MEFTTEQRELIETLGRIRSAQDRLAFLVERGRRASPLESGHKTDAFRVEGCLSRLWVVGEFRDGKCYFRSDSDSVIVKSIAGLVCELFSDHTPEEILNADFAMFSQAGINQLLTANRRNALSGLWEKIRAFARAQLTTPRHPDRQV